MDKMGFVRTYTRDIICSPKGYGGIGYLDMRTEASLLAIETIVRNLRTPGHEQSIIKTFKIA